MRESTVALSPPALQPGEMLCHRWRVGRELGRGGEGRAYQARDLVFDQDVVIKEATPGGGTRLRREFALLRHLHHPNIVQALELLIDGQRALLVQQLAGGPDFRSWARAQEGHHAACRAAAACLRALQYLEVRGVVHGDIKPNNLRVAPEPIGRLPGVRLIDFGLAQLLQDDAPSLRVSAQAAREGATGTLAYAAPEVLAGEGSSAASDLFSVGALLYEALFGDVPNPLLDPSARAITVAPLPSAPALRELLADMLAADPTHRPRALQAIASLGHVAGEDLQVSAQELTGPYLCQPPLIGRGPQLAEIERRIDALGNGGTSAVLVLRGMGKTALARRAVDLARLQGIEVIDGTRPTHSGLTPGTTDDLVQTAARLVNLWTDDAHRAPVLLDLDACDTGTPLGQQIVSQATRAVSTGATRPCLVLCSPLPEAAASVEGVPIDLGPLADHEVEALARSMLYSQPSVPWLPALTTRSGGDPRWVVDLVRLQVHTGSFDVPPAPAAGGTPADPRLARLGSAASELLSAIALAAAPVPAEVLRHAWPHCATALRELRASGLLVDSADAVWIERPALAAAAAGLLDEDAVPTVHRRLAAAWHASSDPDPSAMAHHQLRGGDLGVELLARAPLSATDLSWAAERLPRDDSRWALVQERLARMEQSSGRLDAALRRTQQLRPLDAARAALLEAELLLDAGRARDAEHALAQVPTDTARQRLLAARASFLQGDYAAAEAGAQQGLTTCEQRADPLTCASLAHLQGLSAVYRDRVSEGLAQLERAETLTTTGDAATVRPRLFNSKGIALQRLERFDQAKQCFAGALAEAHGRGDLRVASSSALNLATIEHRVQDLTDALQHFREARALALRAGVPTTEATALANEANLLILCGAHDEAAARLDAARRLAEAAGARALVGRAYLYEAESWLARGRPEQADACVQRAADQFDPSDRRSHYELGVVQAEVQLALGDVHRVHQTCADLLAKPDAEQSERWRLHLLDGTAWCEGPPGSEARALREAEQAVESAPAHERKWQCHALLTRCLHQRDQPARAQEQAARVTSELEGLRKRIPPVYRELFDQRDDVVRARELTRLVAAPDPDSPNAADLARLLELNGMLNQRLAITDLLERILDCAIELTGAERGFVLLRDGNELVVSASRNVDREAIRRGIHKLSRSIAQMAIDERRPVIAADAVSDERFSERVSVFGLKLRAVLCVPLLVRDEVRGALYVDNRFRSGAFDTRHAKLMHSFADQAGIALYNAELVQDLAQHAEALATAKAEIEAHSAQLERQVVEQSEQLGELSERLRLQTEDLVRRFNAANIIGQSKPMRDLFVQIDRLADADAPVFICGESGSGKELVARAMHYQGPRRNEPFVSVNCAAIPHTLLESELFGHVRGAFTGASQDRRGLFEAAGAGTFFLDEVAEMPADTQAKLLRVLQESRFRPVGGVQERQTRCRVLSAGQVPLDKLVAAGTFRADLMYRLVVIPITVPSLRERREDIPELVQHFLAQMDPLHEITPDALAALVDFDWPGNVRQLHNELQRAAVLSGPSIELRALSPALRERSRGRPKGSLRPRRGLSEALANYERRLIQQALEDAGGNVTAAAAQLSVSRVVLHRKLVKLGIGRQPRRGSR